MKRTIVISIILSLTLMFGLERSVSDKTIGLQRNNERPVYIEDSDNLEINKDFKTREEITLFLDDFENGENGWNSPNGNWVLSTDDSHSPTHSFISPDDNNSGQFSSNDLFSPVISLPELGDGEIMHFSFWVRVDMPDYQQEDDPSTAEDESGYLADYYAISALDVEAISWHTTATGSPDGGAIYWVGDEEIGGYLDSWVQYLDSPPVTVPSSGVLSADMKWAIESPAGAVVAGTCTDGWDQANVQISTDGGESFMVIEGSDPYDFDCGYGSVYNGFDGIPGWGGQADWHNVEFDLSSYAGQSVIVRFGFYTDPAYSTADDASITGFYVDNINIPGAFYDDAENPQMEASGEVWVDQFYDYGDATQPGAEDWVEYLPGYPFNGNAFLDISDFAGKDVIFRIQSRYDGDFSSSIGSGQGTGLKVDDFRIYKESSGSYPAPNNLAVEAGDGSADLSWADMNASGTDNFVYDNDNATSGITLTGEGDAYAGTRYDIAGPSTVTEVRVYNLNGAGAPVTLSGFSTLGTLFDTSPLYTQEVTLDVDGWNIIAVDWDFENNFIIGHTFNAAIAAGLDESAGAEHSMVLLGGAWDTWAETVAGSGGALSPGEWGIRSTITYYGANVTYNVYQDGVSVVSGLTNSSYLASGLNNNISYSFSVSATYSDGEESDPTDPVAVTPQAQTVYEASFDDGSFESYYTIGSGNFVAVRFSAGAEGEDIIRFKWYQELAGGALYIKMFEDDNGMPGEETFSEVAAGGLVAGWNERDISSSGLVGSGDFWMGVKGFSSTQGFGFDTSTDSGNSYARQGSDGDWVSAGGNLGIRLLIDLGEGGGGDCTAGDVNADGIINVLDIVSAVNFIMGVSSPSADEECAADFNADGTINVLDIVSIVNVIMGS